MFRKSVWIPILIVLLAVMGCGLFYNSRISNQLPLKFYKRVEFKTSATPKPPIIESAEVIGTPVGAQPIDAQTGAQGKPESSQRTPESREAYNKWVAWEDKHSKLRKEYGQASQEMLDAMPGTEKDAKRYIADENYKREVQRKMQEAMDKSAEILGRMREYEAKRIFPPGTPTQ